MTYPKRIQNGELIYWLSAFAVFFLLLVLRGLSVPNVDAHGLSVAQHIAEDFALDSNYLHNRIAEMETGSTLKTPLLMARYDLNRAKIHLRYDHDAQEAGEDLAGAELWMARAEDAAHKYWTDDLYKQQIRQMEQDVDHVEKAHQQMRVSMLQPVSRELNMVLHSL